MIASRRLSGWKIPAAESCGTPIDRTGFCDDCRDQPPLFTSLRSCYAYLEPARQAIHRLKYQRDIGLADALAAPMTELHPRLSWQIDSVTSVPLSPARLRQRGYNQASLLAFPVALSLNKPYQSKLLQRHRDTTSQVGLSALERRQNVSRGFRRPFSRGENRSGHR